MAKKSKQDRRPIRQLRELGKEIERAREDFPDKLTQESLAELLNKKMESAEESTTRERVHQSQLARLEKGLVADPDPQLLRAIADAVSVKYERLIGCLVKDKYGLSHEKIWPLLNDSLSLDELAKWEASQTELWIIAIKYVDEHQTRFRNAVGQVLKNGGVVTFFIPDVQLQAFEFYRDEVLEAVNKKDHPEILESVPLDSIRQVPLMAASYVIANPQSVSAEDDPNRTAVKGYLILNNEKDEPFLALEIARHQLRSIVRPLAIIKKEYRGSLDRKEIGTVESLHPRKSSSLSPRKTP